MKKKQFTSFCSIFFIIAIFAGCVSGAKEAQRLLDKGDSVGAIEVLSKALIKQSDDKDCVAMFNSLYPSELEKRRPRKSLSEVRGKFASMQDTSDEVEAMRRRISEIGDIQTVESVAKDKSVKQTIDEGESLIQNLEEIVRIQNAVSPMPQYIGTPKDGNYTQVYKYNDDFQGQLADAKREMAEFYYNIAESAFPGSTIEEKKALLVYYEKADSYAKGLYSVNNRCAELYYGIGSIYEEETDLQNKKNALAAYSKIFDYVQSYSDADTKVKKLSYEIGMALKENASSLKDYEEVCKYLEAAKDFRDAKTQLKDVSYEVALLYKAEGTKASYEKAGEYFAQCGDYRNAKNETKLYNFYKKLNTLDNNISNGPNPVNNFSDTKVTLSLQAQGDKAQPSIKKENISSTSTKTVLKETNVTSDIPVFLKGSSSGKNRFFPGAVFDGSSIVAWEQKFIKAARNPIDVTIKANGSVLTSIELDDPSSESYSYRTITEAANSASRSKTVKPVCNYEFAEIVSEYDLSTVLGHGYDMQYCIIASPAGYKPEKSYTLVKVSQIFYTAEMQNPKLPVDLFSAEGGSVSENLLSKVSPYYISSVDYGRKAYVLIESDMSYEEVVADIKNYCPKDSSARLNDSIVSKWKNSRNMYSYQAAPYETIKGFDVLFNWIKDGFDNRLEDNEIYPISYRLKSLKDNSYAKLTMEETFSVDNKILKKSSDNVLVKDRVYTSKDMYSPRVYCGDGPFYKLCDIKASTGYVVIEFEKPMIAAEGAFIVGPDEIGSFFGSMGIYQSTAGCCIKLDSIVNTRDEECCEEVTAGVLKKGVPLIFCDSMDMGSFKVNKIYITDKKPSWYQY